MATEFPANPRPVYRTIFTDAFGHIDQRQETGRCADFELRLADCVEAYGYPKAEEKCLPYLRDLNECVFSPKQLRRTVLMKEERERQIKAGERTKPYEEPPKLDSY